MKTQSINFSQLEKKLRSKFPLSYNEFTSLQKNDIGLDDFIAFFKQRHIELNFRETMAFTENYIGTYNFSVVIKKISDLKKLNRKLNYFSYYGINSLDKAATKALIKG